MDRFIELEKNDFIGREAAARENGGRRPKLRRVSLVVDAADADVMGDEPIWAKVDGQDYGTVEKPHGYGAPRFDAAGKEVRGSTAATGASAVRGIIDGDWRVVGWVTSGGYAHYVGKSLAQGYVPAALAEDESEGLFEIEILGHRRAGAHQCRAAVRSDRREDAGLARSRVNHDRRPPLRRASRDTSPHFVRGEDELPQRWRISSPPQRGGEVPSLSMSKARRRGGSAGPPWQKLRVQ